jgi:hypothetical protein
MASSHASVVIGYRNEVVHGFAVIAVDDVRAHVKARGGELHLAVDLVTPVPVVAKPLQADDQDRGKHPQVKLFRGLLMFLTTWTIPIIISKLNYGKLHISFSQNFFI